MQAVILSIGDELTLGQCVDTNSAWLSERLTLAGVTVRAHVTVADDQPDIAAAFTHASRAADLVIATGGLGPTDDDLTRQALADAMNVALQLHQPSLATIEHFFASLGRPMPAKNRIQAMCPAGASPLPNDHGTAPGIHARIGDCNVFVFPGVPREMRPMYAAYVEPFLDQHAHASRGGILTERLLTFGRGESSVAEALGDLCRRDRNPLVGTTVSEGIVSVRIRSSFSDPHRAQDELDRTVAACRAALGDLVFGRGGETLANAAGDLLRQHAHTIATAESCTGGLVAMMLTDAAGSSDYFVGGYVTYANEAKTRELGVPAPLIERHGAVSEPVARAMAEGALERSGAHHAVAVTGIAGPAGGSPEKPVGTVWFALASRGQPTLAQRHQFPGDRPTVRDRAAKMALNLVRLRLLHSHV